MSPPPTFPARILVVEDHPEVSATIRYLLKRAGCETRCAGTAADALRWAALERFDLITLDLDLPDMDGTELFRQFQRDPRLDGVPMVFVSARSSEEDRQRCLDLGGADYIAKPFDAPTFVTRILARLKITGEAGRPDGEVFGSRD